MQIISRSDAKERGLTRYFTGRPCTFGHVAERMVTNWTCVVCTNAWGRSHPEAKRLSSKRWAKKNMARVLAKHDAWRRANPAKSNAWRKAWKKANPEKVATVNKAWRDANKDRARETGRVWAAANIDRKRARNAKAERKRLLKIKQQTPAWANEAAMLEFYRNCPPGHQVDHVVPLNGRTVSGLHCIANLQYLPNIENKIKGNRWPL